MIFLNCNLNVICLCGLLQTIQMKCVCAEMFYGIELYSGPQLNSENICMYMNPSLKVLVSSSEFQNKSSPDHLFLNNCTSPDKICSEGQGFQNQPFSVFPPVAQRYYSILVLCCPCLSFECFNSLASLYFSRFKSDLYNCYFQSSLRMLTLQQCLPRKCDNRLKKSQTWILPTGKLSVIKDYWYVWFRPVTSERFISCSWLFGVAQRFVLDRISVMWFLNVT